jgi:hypothetical protein
VTSTARGSRALSLSSEDEREKKMGEAEGVRGLVDLGQKRKEEKEVGCGKRGERQAGGRWPRLGERGFCFIKNVFSLI